MRLSFYNGLLILYCCIIAEDIYLSIEQNELLYHSRNCSRIGVYLVAVNFQLQLYRAIRINTHFDLIPGTLSLEAVNGKHSK